MTASAPIHELLADPLAAARTAARGGSRVIGYVGNDIPVALILAADALPVRLRGLAGPTPRADRFLESSFTPDTRSIAEQWLAGDLDFLDAVVFARSDDAGQRLYYYVCELQRRGGRYAIVSACVGGGQGMALLIENPAA